MKKTIFSIILTALLIACFSGQSWAFGSRHHHHDQNNGNQGSSSSTDDNGNESDLFGNNTGDGLNFGNNFQDQDVEINNNTSDSNLVNSSDNSSSDNNPADPVPEPTTLFLLGIGLTLVLLQRKYVKP